MPAAIVRSAATLGLERAMLVSLALVLSLAACQEPEQATGPSLSQATMPKSITLTYICGNSFRVRNTNATAVTVTWDVYQKGETNTLVLPPKPASAPYSETYFTTVNKGTVRLFLDGALIQTKANGNKPVCQLPVGRPPIPVDLSYPDDSAYVVSDPTNPDIRVYRRLAIVAFATSATDAEVTAFFTRFGATVVGGVAASETYYVQFPDPGSTWEALDSVLTLMGSQAGVELISEIARWLPSGPIDARYPTDGAGFSRLDWASNNSTDWTWALRAIRAPLAWGCETGTYSAEKVKVAVLEQAFLPNADIQVSTTVHGKDQSIGLFLPQDTVNLFEWHGSAVAGALSATGDNQIGTVGAMWSTNLTIYELTPTNRSRTNPAITLGQQFVTDMIVRRPRILSISSEVGLSPKLKGSRAFLLRRFRQLLDAVPELLIVMAAGNEGTAVAPGAARADVTRTIRAVLVELAVSGYRDRIVFAGATAPTHTLWSGSSWITGMTDIAAPGQYVGVPGLARGGTPYSSPVVLGSGTSFSAPLVAGVAAQILSMNPSLPPSQVKQLLLDGAKLPRFDPTTGQIAPDSNLAFNVPGTADKVYQLDAYGSLSLLSATDDATPICGFPVTTSFVTNPETSEIETVVRIARPSHIESIYQGNVENVTVAQGGRRIGIDSYDESHNINFQTTSWTVGSPMAFRGYRQFLEKDTAFIDYSGSSPHITVRGAGNPRGPYSPCEGVGPSLPTFGTDCYLGPISPSGEWAQVTVNRSNYDVTGCGSGAAFHGSYFVPLAASSTQQVLREIFYEPCFPRGLNRVPVKDVVAWRADGTVAWVGQSDYSFFVSAGVPDSLNPYPYDVSTPVAQQTQFEQVSTALGVPVQGPKTLSGILTYALGWRTEGSTLISYESDGFDWWGTCRRVVRAGLAPEIVLADSTGPVAYCLDAVMEPLAASPRSPKSGPAAPSMTVLDERNRLDAIRSRSVQRLVLAN